MALRYYDDAIISKFQKWIKSKSLRILKPDESDRLFSLESDTNNDAPIKLPLISLSRDTSFNILRTVKNKMSYSGYTVGMSEDKSMSMPLNAIPIHTIYQLDIITKKADEADEYLRNFIFNIINHPKLYITIPYNGTDIQHVANIKILDTVTDNSDIPLRMYSGQFTRWTIQFELLDAYLFSIPYTENWKIEGELVEEGDAQLGVGLDIIEDNKVTFIENIKPKDN